MFDSSFQRCCKKCKVYELQAHVLNQVALASQASFSRFSLSRLAIGLSLGLSPFNSPFRRPPTANAPAASRRLQIDRLMLMRPPLATGPVP